MSTIPHACYPSDEIVPEVRRLAAKGLGRDRIARELGRNRGSIEAIMVRHGIRAANLPRVPIEKIKLITEVHDEACRRGERATDMGIATRVRAMGVQVTDETVRLVLALPNPMVQRMLAEHTP